jgi:hypothetical protein
VNALRFSPQALGLCAIVAMLAGCGGAQTATTNATLPQSAVQSKVHQASGSSGELVYLTTKDAVLMVSYPQGQIVGKIAWYFPYGIICSDPNTGNVFLPEGETVYEYAHGGTTPIATVSFPSGYSSVGGCAVDPTTGNLAQVAATVIKGQSTTAVLVYPQAQGAPTIYLSKKLTGFDYPAYDDAGNLFVTAETKKVRLRIGELPAGGNDFTVIKLSEYVYPTKIQWDGTHLCFEYNNGTNGSTVIDQVKIAGRTGTIVNAIRLAEASTVYDEYFWIQNGSAFAVYGKIKQNNNIALGVWRYPSGGNPTARYYGMTNGRKDYIWDMTVSVNPSH